MIKPEYTFATVRDKITQSLAIHAQPHNQRSQADIERADHGLSIVQNELREEYKGYLDRQTHTTERMAEEYEYSLPAQETFLALAKPFEILINQLTMDFYS